MKYIKIVFCLSLLLSLVSCTKDFDEINTDPDRASSALVPAANVLAFCERYPSEYLFNEWLGMRNVGGYCGHIAQTFNTQESCYSDRPSTNDLQWEMLYRTIANLSVVMQKSEVNSNMWAAANVFQCQMFQIVCDTWGDVPYSEACRLGTPVVKPKYDAQSFIYLDLLKRLKQSAEAFDDNGDQLGSGDVLLNGNIDFWRRYANALRLRIAARIAKVDPATASAVVSEIMSSPDSYPIPESNSHNIFYTAWGTGCNEPWAANASVGYNEFSPTTLLIKELTERSDPRLPVYAMPTTNYLAGKSDIPYAGHQQGLRANANLTAVSGIGERFCHRNDFEGFSPWLRSCETYFALAYLSHLGIAVPGIDEESAYNKAVRLSLEENEIADTAIDKYLTVSEPFNGTEEQLMTQWWIALFKNSYEAWSVFRMSGYPTGNVIAPDAVFSGHNTPPLSYYYPPDEYTFNAENCAKAAAVEVDKFWGKKMWWDTRTDVY